MDRWPSTTTDDSIELVIFDLDGVLVDSEVLGANAIIDLLNEYGVVIDLLFVRKNFIGKSFSTVIGVIEDNFGIKLPGNFETKFLDRLNNSFSQNLRAIPAALETVKALKVNCCVATSSAVQRARWSLELTGMLGFFEDHIYCSSMVRKPKPAPDLFLFASERENIPASKTLVVEDSVAGLRAGLAAGMRTVRFVGGSHIKGLKPVNEPPVGIELSFDSWEQFRRYYPSLFVEESDPASENTRRET